MNSISKNIEIIRNNIVEACKLSGRNPDDIEILCASKFRTIEELEKVNECGVKAFGENRVQEFVSKYDERFTFDFIGQLQTNKVKYVSGKVRLIQSLDRINLAEEIDKQSKKRGIVQKCLIEINSGAEEAKGGVLLEDVDGLLSEVSGFDNLKVVGLMAVAPKTDEDELRRLFTAVNNEFLRLKAKYADIKILSMGMSNDYKLAVECGSTMIRPGKAIFE